MARVETTSKTKVELRPYDVTRYLQSEEDIIGYLNAVLEENDPGLLMAAIGDVARAKGMTQISRETGLSRESLYRSLSEQGNPEFATVQKVLQSLGLRLTVAV